MLYGMCVVQGVRAQAASTARRMWQSSRLRRDTRMDGPRKKVPACESSGSASARASSLTKRRTTSRRLPAVCGGPKSRQSMSPQFLQPVT